MADKQFFGVLTEIGVAQMTNALLLDEKVDFSIMAIGDGGGVPCVPSSTQTSLVNEVHRVNITGIKGIEGADPNAPAPIEISAVIPSSVGGFTMRELGVYTSDGLLLAVCNTPVTEKVAISDGVVADVGVAMTIIVSSTKAIEFVVDPTVILATKADIKEHNADPNAHLGHFANTDLHCSAEEKERWNGADILSKSNKIEIDLLKLGQKSDDSRLQRLEDSLFNDIVGNPYLITFVDLEGVILTKGIWNKNQNRLEC